MVYFFVILLLLAFEFLYLRVASRRENLIEPFWKKTTGDDHPDVITVRGGGIVFWFAALLLLIFNPSELNLWFFTAITAVAAINFYNDLSDVSAPNARAWIQVIIHIVAISIAFYLADVFEVVTWWNLLFAYLLFWGVMNAFKLMDDVNGMTGLYSMAVLLPLIYVNLYIETFVHVYLLFFPTLAAFIFLMFNYRKKAASTAGDVGSMSIGFWVTFLLLLLIVDSRSLVWVSFVLVYLVDVLLTMVQRIYQRKAFFGTEKLHFYQILGNELRVDHRVVSMLYFFTQLICSALAIVLYPSLGIFTFWILLFVLIAMYALKYRLVRVAKQLQ